MRSVAERHTVPYQCLVALQVLEMMVVWFRGQQILSIAPASKGLAILRREADLFLRKDGAKSCFPRQVRLDSTLDGGLVFLHAHKASWGSAQCGERLSTFPGHGHEALDGALELWRYGSMELWKRGVVG